MKLNPLYSMFMRATATNAGGRTTGADSGRTETRRSPSSVEGDADIPHNSDGESDADGSHDPRPTNRTL